LTAGSNLPLWHVTLAHRRGALVGVRRTYAVQGRTLHDAEIAARAEYEKTHGAGSARPDVMCSVSAYRVEGSVA
jgi:hypothetical protein